ncbi:MAG: hypothetical protein AABY07_03285 [Nanoarchaeota archaeon]
MTNIRSYKVSINTTGGAGVATGEADSVPFAGRILSVEYIPGPTSPPATTDVTAFITRDGDKDTNVETLSTFTNVSTANVKRYPKKEVDDGAGTSLAAANKTNVFAEFTTAHGIHVEVAQSDALSPAAIVEVIVEE